MVVQEIHERDWKIRMACCESILENIYANVVLLTSDKAYRQSLSVYSLAASSSRIFATGLKPIHTNFMKDLYTANEFFADSFLINVSTANDSAHRSKYTTAASLTSLAPHQRQITNL